MAEATHFAVYRFKVSVMMQVMMIMVIPDSNVKRAANSFKLEHGRPFVLRVVVFSMETLQELRTIFSCLFLTRWTYLFIYLSILICIPYINIFFLFYQCCEHWVYPPVAWQTLSQPTTRTAAWLSTSILTKKGILWTISMTPSGEIPISRVIVSFFCLSLLFSISFNDSLIGQFGGLD